MPTSLKLKPEFRDKAQMASKSKPGALEEAGATVGDSITVANGRWSFGGDTGLHIEEHATRSIPGYRDGYTLILEFSDFFIGPTSKIIDAGCGVGWLTHALAVRHRQTGAHVLGVDVEVGMILEAQRRCMGCDNVTLVVDDAANIDYSGADIVILYYVLQFMPVGARTTLLAKIFREMRHGGLLVVFEKVRFDISAIQDFGNQIYECYKIANGYTPDEILAKARSLRGVLAPCTRSENHALIQDVGFLAPETIYRFLAFEGLLALRPIAKR